MSNTKQEVIALAVPANTTDEKNSCPPNIWTELLAVRDMVVEQRLELRNTDAKLRATRGVVEKLTIDNEAMEARLKVSEGLVAGLKKEMSERSAVVFSSALGCTIGPYDNDTPVVFKRVYINIGGAFDSSTGVFTAKVKGVYHFAITGFGRGTHRMILSMYKNSQKVISAFHNSSNDYYINMSNSVSLQLEVGENVYVQLRSGAVAYDDHDVVTTFSGHLLFPM